MQPLRIVALRVVQAVVRPAALLALDCRGGHHLCAVQHEPELDVEQQVGVEHLALRFHADGLEALLQRLDLLEAFLQLLFLSEHLDLLVHHAAHVHADVGDAVRGGRPRQ